MSYSYGSDPSHFVEVPDLMQVGQTKRPIVGTPLTIQDAITQAPMTGMTDLGGNALASVVTLSFGYVAFRCPSPSVRVSADAGETWKRLIGVEALDTAINAGPVAASASNTANAALSTALTALGAVKVFAAYEASGAYPLRATVTSDAGAMVLWCGPDTPPIGGGYALGHDRWEQET